MTGKTVAIVVAATTAGTAALGALTAYLLKRKKGVKPAIPAGRALSSFLSRKPASWYEQLPLFPLKNSKGMEVVISPIGAAIVKMIVPDKKGKKADVVLGYDNVETYVKGEPVTYFGVVVGRCANRIANAKFKIGDQQYELLANNGPNALHGGRLGLHKRRFDSRPVSGDSFTGVELTYDSPPGEEGYPGNLRIVVTYHLAKDKNELTTTITATTDEATPVNIAQHTYFNLAGHASGNILNHSLKIYGDHYTPVNDQMIPTGQIAPVKGTPLDFTEPHTIGERIDKVPAAPPGGYDHNYVLFNMGTQAKFITKNGVASEKPKLAASVTEPSSGRSLDIFTTAPGVQFYSGNFLDGSAVGKGGVKYQKHAGFCLETQGFPNAVNEAAFPSVVLQPQDQYFHQLIYKFN
mmetsp:Transcript_26051/g.56870  ORF Transcript_26051/g.56870 Transcript_26051/m.56870 type:complete len:407 (-) Transcript_26051:662-1882(-)|eukprot:CAMPEP_0202904850 /NCGR_PEP_ID=MMETSP1392-20130828/31421_1 /ASSEMBLY_ACC=CAM_ASM_000868 /TAXON_ID=225041 /ORGANISM="Chlamydomonas chlamydogama, Strain SAG 11-48b" /LENGTH=406 /DNA_ID=CAMNT_0049592691 /DNA_START=46 /DNA_END=1266 /DNA_ORIENTATION=-